MGENTKNAVQHGATTRMCSRCNTVKPLTEFHRDNRKPGGRNYRCADCTNEYKRKNAKRLYAAQAARFERNREEIAPKRKAWNAVYYAVRTGKLTRPSTCERCGRTDKTQAHHHDYSKLLEVTWVCQWCHAHLEVGRVPAA